MSKLIAKEPTKVEKLTEQVETLQVVIQQKDAELEQTKIKVKKHVSLGYYRSRFK